MSNPSGREKREKLFNVLSLNLKPYIFENDDIFACPLCGDGFSRKALDYEDILTLEHCVSGKLGGTLETLTCKKCNNEHSSLLDAHIVNKHRSEDSVMGLNGSPLKGQIRVGDAEVRVKITIKSDPTSFQVDFVEKATHPAALRAAVREIEEKGKIPDGLKFQLGWSMNYKQRRYEVGLLRSAYLTLFHWFGYRYFFRPSSERIRQQIDKPDDIVLPGHYILPLGEEFSNTNRIYVIVGPVDLRGFLVPIKLVSDHRTTAQGVLLPGFGDDAERVYVCLRDMQESKTKTLFKCNWHENKEFLLSVPPSELPNETLWKRLLQI